MWRAQQGAALAHAAWARKQRLTALQLPALASRLRLQLLSSGSTHHRALGVVDNRGGAWAIAGRCCTSSCRRPSAHQENMQAVS
jgi:hypothetical protein